MEDQPEKPKKPERKPEDKSKKMCGTCKWKYGEEWSCQFDPDLLCPAPMMDNSKIGKFAFCRGYEPKPRKPRPSQLKPERVKIPPGVRFLYFGNKIPGSGVMTVAYSICEKLYSIELGFAFSNMGDPKKGIRPDPPNKYEGRKQALERLLKTEVNARYLYDPTRLVFQVGQAVMEHQWAALVGVIGKSGLYRSGLVEHTPGWTIALAQRLQTRKVSGVSRLKLFEQRSFPVMIETTTEGLSPETASLIRKAERRRPPADQILARTTTSIWEVNREKGS